MRQRHGGDERGTEIRWEGKLTWEGAVGVAIGILGVSLDDFYRLSPIELRRAVEANAEQHDNIVKTIWETSRIVAWIVAKQGFSKFRKSPQQFLPLPWDKKRERTVMSREEQEKRLRKLLGDAEFELYRNSKYWPFKS